MRSAVPDRSPPGSPGVAFWLYGLHLWTVFGIALSNICFALTGIFSVRELRRSPVPWSRIRSALVPLGLYAALLLASTVLSYDPAISLHGARDVLSLATLPLAFALARGEKRIARLVDGFVLVSALVAILGLAQFLIGYGDINHRIRGPFSHYMTFSGVLLLADLLLIAEMVCGSAWKSRWRWAALVFINLALIGSLTRSAWVALGLSVTVLLVIRAPRLIAAYVPAALLFVVLAPVPVLHRVVSIADLRDGSNYDRLCMAEAAIFMVRERPVFGLGPGMVDKRYPIYSHPTALRQWVPHLHNSFLQIAAEKGLLALAAYLWLMAESMRRAFRLHGRMPGRSGALAMGAFVALLGFNLAGLFEDNWSDTEVQRVALFLAAMPYCLGIGAASSAGSAATDGDPDPSSGA